MRVSSVTSPSVGAVALALFLGQAACSDPVPPPAQGGARIRTTQASPPDPTRTCSRVGGGHTATIPAGNLIDSMNPGDRVVSGTNGAVVTCTVKEAGGGFNFNGSIEQGGVQLSVSGNVSGQTGAAQVSSYSNQTLGLSSSAPHCTVTVNAGKVGAGFIYAEYDCPGMIDPSEGSLLCRGNGTFVFENCVSE